MREIALFSMMKKERKVGDNLFSVTKKERKRRERKVRDKQNYLGPTAKKKKKNIYIYIYKT